MMTKKTVPVRKIHFTVKCPSGSVYQCSARCMDGPSTLSQVLFDEVERQTGTPANLQILSFLGQFILPDIPLCQYSLENGNCLNLSVKGLGGGGGDSSSGEKRTTYIIYNILLFDSGFAEIEMEECVSCGERAYMYCNDCESSRCKTCNDQWHKHPKRRCHQTNVRNIYVEEKCN